MGAIKVLFCSSKDSAICQDGGLIFLGALPLVLEDLDIEVRLVTPNFYRKQLLWII